jgi:hypothetical protein
MIGMKVTETRYRPHYTVSWAHTTNKTLAVDAAFDCLYEAVSARFFYNGIPFFFPLFVYYAFWKKVTISSTHLRTCGAYPTYLEIEVTIIIC